jgi:hypothetical protein
MNNENLKEKTEKEGISPEELASFLKEKNCDFEVVCDHRGIAVAEATFDDIIYEMEFIQRPSIKTKISITNRWPGGIENGVGQRQGINQRRPPMNTEHERLKQPYSRGLRVLSMYSSISAFFQKFLCPILYGFGKFGLFFIQTWIVTLEVLNIFFRSLISSNLSISSMIKNLIKLSVNIHKEKQEVNIFVETI